MNLFPSAKFYGLGILFLMLILFSFAGYKAMRPQGTQKDIDRFWISVIAFLVLLAIYVGVFVSPFFAIAPLFPIYIFIKLYLATRKSTKK